MNVIIKDIMDFILCIKSSFTFILFVCSYRHVSRFRGQKTDLCLLSLELQYGVSHLTQAMELNLSVLQEHGTLLSTETPFHTYKVFLNFNLAVTPQRIKTQLTNYIQKTLKQLCYNNEQKANIFQR